MDDDDRYIALLEQLEERLNGDTEQDRFRAIARQEANKRIEAYLVPLGAAFVGWYVVRHYGQEWFWLLVGAAAAWFVWSVVRLDYDPKHDRHLVSLRAQDIARLDHMRALDAEGIDVWEVEEGTPRRVGASGGTHWDGWWRTTYLLALDLEKLSPRARGQRVRAASRAAIQVLEKGEQLAKREHAELAYWATDALNRARSSPA